MKKSLQKSILLLLFSLLCLVQQSFAEETNRALLPTVTLTTEAIAPTSIFPNGTGVAYIVKVESTEAFILNNISFKMSGTYIANDLIAAYVYKGTSNNFASATYLSGAGVVGSGGTLSFNAFNTSIAANSTTYFFLQVYLKTTATIGNTIKVNGADSPSPVTLTSTASTLTIINNQTDIAGPLTISTPSLVYSTEPLSSFNADPAATGQMIYVMKIQNQYSSSILLTQIGVKFAGTFLAGDISSVSLAISTTPNTTGIGASGSFSGVSLTNGTTFTTPSLTSWSLPSNSVRYLLVRVDIANSAAGGRTIKIDGSNNPVVLTTSTTTTIVNNQTDITGTLTINTPEITLSTEPVSAAFILPNSSGTISVTKITSTTGSVLKGMNIPIQGTFTNSDVSSWNVFLASSPTATSGTFIGSYTYTSGVLTNSPSGLTIYTLPANTPMYLIVRPLISSTAINGRTLKVNSSTNPVTVIANGTPVVTNNQTDVAGTQTIQGPIVTITTEPKVAATVLPNSSTEIYNFKAISDKATKIDQLSFKIEGTFTAGKIVEIYVYENTTNTISGSPILTLSTLTKTTGDVFTFALGASYGFLAANTAKYYKFVAKMSPTLPDGYDVKVNGTTNMLTFTAATTSYPGTAFIDNQTDIFGTQTVLAPLPTGSSAQSGFVSTVTTTEKTAYTTNYLGIVATLKANPQINSSVTCSVWPTGGSTLNYVARHYEMSANAAPVAPTATITLYFSQAEFDAYNLLPALDLPTSSTDATGKANLRIKKYATLSTSSNGVVYTGSPVEIDPDDAKIIFQNGRWEVTFDASNFGGLFLGTVAPPCPGTGVSPSSAILTCTNPTASITAMGGGTYSWTGPSGFTSTTATISASVAGNYIVTAVTTNNCTAISTVVVTTNQTTPTVTITPTSSVLTCTNPTASITAAGGSTYAWAGPSGFTSANASISASMAGSYIVTVTGANGCTSTASVSVTNNNTPPSVSVSPTSAILICGSPTASITASGGSTYAWTGSSGFTSTTAMITANAGGNYVVNATGANGCTATTSVMVTDNIAPVAPTISPSGTATLCPPATSLTLTASGCAGGTITWNTSPTPSTGTSITVTQAGSFSATCMTTCGTSSTSATTVVSTICICLLNMTLGSDNWSNASNWSCGHIPVATEPVQISLGHTVTLDVNGAAKSLDLRGILNKQATKVLTIQGN
jgi:hypothetical protein